MPRIETHRISRLEVKPHFGVNPDFPDFYGMSRDDMGVVLDQIPVCSIRMLGRHGRLKDICH